VEQWCSRLDTLHNRTSEWWQELRRIVNRRIGIPDPDDDVKNKKKNKKKKKQKNKHTGIKG